MKKLLSFLESFKEFLASFNLIWLSSKQSSVPSKGNVHHTLLGNSCDMTHFTKVKFAWLPRRVNLANCGDVQVVIWLHHYSEQYRAFKFLDTERNEPAKKLYDFLFYFEDQTTQTMRLPDALAIIEAYNVDPQTYNEILLNGLRASAVFSPESKLHQKMVLVGFVKGNILTKEVIAREGKHFVMNLRYLMAMSYYVSKKVFSKEEIMEEAFKCSIVDESNSHFETKIR